MTTVGEPMRRDRAAAAGKYCVWVEPSRSRDFRLPNDFATFDEAKDAASKVVEQDTGHQISRVLVYDSQGFFEYKLVRHD